jgi:chromosome segregation ATPase
MQNRPTARELAEAVREFLEEEVLPELEDPRAKFRTRVAMNALSILERELSQEEPLLQAEHERLARLLGKDRATPDSLEELREQVIELNRDLTGRIRSGETPEGTFEHLRQTVTDKLKVASPSYLERYGQ